ncbi:Sarcosine oxidase subunit alpha [Hyphomicrobiales bacterium]|nr:Sarcosine oxidase subunit alpha [Hyphomicrobiales bacterium]CAH1673613.1 Sarcosine oxidase subunit alpha [Hyphomicrobiales bacterium]
MGATSHRLATGGLIDRSRSLSFDFDGREYIGHPGDTLASALLANGVSLVGRSFKYHRPRGILSAGFEEPNALVELRTGSRREPNSRATVVELYEGLTARSQNRWPSLACDLLAVNSLFAPVLAAGFYYKTFMWPAAFWEKVYEPLIRRAAGLGRAAEGADPDHYEKATAYCDVLVIGAGPAGLAAALAAARTGARVILCESDFQLGGRCLAENVLINDMAGSAWARSVEAELASFPDVQIMPRTTVFGVYDGGTYGAVESVGDNRSEPLPHQPRQRLWRIVARRSVLATGSLERPMVFDNNDRPGIMLAGGVRSYLNRFAVAPGRRAVIFANTDDSARTASELAGAGVSVAAIVDARTTATDAVIRVARTIGCALIPNATVTHARGGRHLRGVEITTADGRRLSLACDLLAMSGGWDPTLHLTAHLGGRPAWDEERGCFTATATPPGMVITGAAGGGFTLAEALKTGALGGLAAAEACGFSGQSPRLTTADEGPAATGQIFSFSSPGRKAFVDFQNDVTLADIRLAAREGFKAVEHLKRYTTLGMGTDQGKSSNVNALAVMAGLAGGPIASLGTTTFRPPFTPVAMGALGGHARGKDFRPTRLTPSHAFAAEQGAVFVEAGAWLRAQYFPQPGEHDWLQSATREARAVRGGVGVCDVSTLGKIDIQGPDAATFLERLYTNSWKNLPVGKARYGLMLREDGFVMDDGTTSRLADEHFLMTTTTANAVGVLQHMEFCHQCLWPELDVQFVSVTEQWAQYSVAGPRARDLLTRLVDAEHDLSNVAFPYMAAREITVCGGVQARLFRISFSGELAYEIAVPARYGDAMVRAIMAVGRDDGIVMYGTEALTIMRVEKGHAAGGELNGQTTVRDLGLGGLMSTKKDYIGRVLAGRPALTDPSRPTLVGFRPVDRSARLRAGAHFLERGAKASPAEDQGYLTSAAFSPVLGHWIGLGLLRRGRERIGDVVRAYDPVRNGDTEVEVCDPVFYDPAGERLRV